jgi:hypothetical protein
MTFDEWNEQEMTSRVMRDGEAVPLPASEERRRAWDAAIESAKRIIKAQSNVSLDRLRESVRV